MLTKALNAVSELWDSMLGRFALIALTCGWVPFLLLSKAHAALAS